WRPDLPPVQRRPRQLSGRSVRMASVPSLRDSGSSHARRPLLFGSPLWIRCAWLVSSLQPTGGHISTEPRINDRIRVPEVRLVGPAGEQVGIVRIEDALRLAREAELDLVEVAPMARPPVVKLMDYGKFKYENA